MIAFQNRYVKYCMYKAESIFYQPGDKITVGFNNKALHIFDKEKKTNLYYYNALYFLR